MYVANIIISLEKIAVKFTQVRHEIYKLHHPTSIDNTFFSLQRQKKYYLKYLEKLTVLFSTLTERLHQHDLAR